MRILLTSPDQSTLTGQPMYVKNLAKGLRELGHEVICSENLVELRFSDYK